MNPPGHLPPVRLDPALFLTEKVAWAGEGPLEVFRPALPEHRPSDPKAPHLVCLPGLGADALKFIRQLPLGRTVHLHALRHPAHWAPEERGVGGLAHWVETYLKAEKLDGPPGVILLGSSMGGVAALATALRAKVAIRGVILAGSFGSCRRLFFPLRIIAPLAYLIPVAVARKVAGWIISRTRHFGGFTAEEQAFLKRCVHIPSRRFFGRAVRVLTRLDLIPALSALRVPVLVVHGNGDQVLPLAAGRELAQAIPGAGLVVLDGAGHALFFTHSWEVNAAVLDFLEKMRLSGK